MSGPGDALKPDADAVRLRVRLTPRAARDSVGGFERLASGETVLVVHVRAVPEKGAANRALEVVLADALDLPKSRVEVIAGETARVKMVRLRGAPDTVSAAIERLAHR